MSRIITKDNKLIVLKFQHHVDKIKWLSYYEISAYDYNTHKMLGYAQFDWNNKQGYLKHINILNSGDLNVGIGTAILDAVEHYLRAHNITQIFGVYVPNGAGKFITPYFYKKRGYDCDGMMLKKDLFPANQPQQNNKEMLNI